MFQAFRVREMVQFAGIEEVVDFDTFVAGIHDVPRKEQAKVSIII
jgi:hypothetical protein